MNCSAAAHRAAFMFAVAMCLVPSALAAQSHHPGATSSSPHAKFTPQRGGTAADTARALEVVRRLREAIAPYADPETAAAAGYKLGPLAEMQPGKRLVHMGNPELRLRRDSGFDPGTPQALLYRRARNGELVLAGAMFTAPGIASDEDLNTRIPLSVARWHKHVNVCLPPPGTPRSRELRQATTPEACTRAGGRFRGESARYMVHVMTDAGDDLARVFPQGRSHSKP